MVLPALLSVSIAVPAAERKLCFADVEADVKRLAMSIASQYTDKSCVFLHIEDLESEAKVAFVNVIEKNWFDRAKTRAEFFKVVKAAMSNKMRSLVQQYRFTQKRTGIKPPPKHERNMNFESVKPNEISLDDPDAHLQVTEEDQGFHEEEENLDSKELRREIEERLMPIEQLVLAQLERPNIHALNYALIDSARKQKPGCCAKIDITAKNQADGLGISEELFQKAVLQIQTVTLKVRDEMNPEDQRYEMSLGALAQLFNLQIPKSTPPMVVRRMLTIAARDNWQKVNPEVEEMLCHVGAEAPKFDKDAMRCFGVLYLRGHRLCESCGVKVPCMTQAANKGLGDITIHPKLLGAKLRRTPFVVPTASPAKPLLTSSMRDAEVIGYLSRNFKRVTHQGDLYFQIREFSDKQKLLFCIGQSAIPLRLRFCNPCPALRKKLLYQNKGYYVSEIKTAEEVIEMINEHAKFAYA